MMNYLFWSPTKIINFLGSLWLSYIKYVRSIIYDIFVLNLMVFYKQILIFLASNQLTTSIHLPCHCTVHEVIYFSDSMTSFLTGSELVQFFFIVFFINVLLLEIPLFGLKSRSPINRFNLAIFACLFLASSWISNILYRICFTFNNLRWEGISFCWYCWNCWPSLFSPSFHNYQFPGVSLAQ